MVKGLERECFNHYSWMDRANTTVINILFAFIDLDDISKDIEGELSSKSLGAGFVSQSHQIEEFSEHRGYLLNYVNDVLYDISDYLEEPLYKGFHEAMDIMATIDMRDGKTDNTIGLQVDVQTSGGGRSYGFRNDMQHLTLEDFIGSRYGETDGNSYSSNTYNQKVNGFADLFAEDYAMFIQYGKLNPEESTLDDYLESLVLKEFAHKKDSPFLIELLEQLSELTIVIPIYEAYTGKTLITQDNLTATEGGYKLVSATVNAITLGYGGVIISKGGVSVAKLFSSELISEITVSSTVIGCEKVGVPSSVTIALALLAGTSAGVMADNVLLKGGTIKLDDLEVEKLNKGGKYSAFGEMPEADGIQYKDWNYEKIHEISIHNPNSDSMTLGKYFDGTIESGSYVAKAESTGDTYFSLGNKWDDIKDAYKLTDKEMFEMFNESAIDDAVTQGKTIRFSQNPTSQQYEGSALANEWGYLKNKYNYVDLIKEGDYWYAIK